jgi:hypothetical protein
LIHSMRLSLMKGAHADLSSTAWQEIGVKPYFGLSGITALDVPLLVCHPGRSKSKQTAAPGSRASTDHSISFIALEAPVPAV